jgi:HSF-type DNA-binding
MASSPQQERKGEKVEHNYRDHANTFEEDLSGASKPANASDRHFPVKMHYMLAELEQDGLDHIVSWQPHGRAFVVHNQAEFVRTILPT